MITIALFSWVCLRRATFSDRINVDHKFIDFSRCDFAATELLQREAGADNVLQTSYALELAALPFWKCSVVGTIGK